VCLEESSIGEFLLNLLLVVWFVLLNAFFVAAEIALAKLRQTHLVQHANETKSFRAVCAQKVRQKPEDCLSACQLGITAASLALGWIGVPAVAGWMEVFFASANLPANWNAPVSIILAFAAVTFLHVLPGTLLSKFLSVQKAESILLWTAPPLLMATRLFRPLLRVLNRFSSSLLRKAGIPHGEESGSAHTQEDLPRLAGLRRKTGHLDQTELALFDKIFAFSQRLAREIMIPRIDMICLYDDYSFEECLAVIRKTRHSRFPVAHEDKDRLIGFVHASDFYLAAVTNGQAEIQNLLRPLLTVPETMEISHVLQLMQKAKCQMAIVIDEYGGTAGLITMEDILEEIVGEIQDEFDEETRPEIEWISADVLSVSGKTLLSRLSHCIGIDVSSPEVDTVAGWLYNQLGGAAAENSSITYQGYRFTVSEWQQHRIIRVKICLADNGEPPGETGWSSDSQKAPLLTAQS